MLAALASLSCALALWQWLAARKFLLHQKIAVPGFAPAVSILKPLKGCDETTADSLASWFKQTYEGPTEILFGVAEAGDPVCEIVRRLIAENPNCRAQLVICENLAGTNAKAAKLAQLEKLAAHDLILISDADVRVPPDFLAGFVTQLRDEKIALVNCFYRLANPTTTAMRWEAVAVNADFWSQVLQSQTLKPLDFALGAAMLVRRKALNETGGFAAVADYLADDYQLGQRIAKNGHRIALCPVVVECWDAPQTWTRVWKHQLRWARTIRVCQPAPYFFSILSNVTLWAMLWFMVGLSKLSASVTEHGAMHNFQFSFALPWGAIMAPAFCLVRIFLAQNLQRRFTPERNLISPAWLVPVRDLLNVAIWFVAFLGNTIEWRGQKMKLRRDGTLVEI
jgi:ceramide glucosyltransferase